MMDTMNYCSIACILVVDFSARACNEQNALNQPSNLEINSSNNDKVIVQRLGF